VQNTYLLDQFSDNSLNRLCSLANPALNQQYDGGLGGTALRVRNALAVKTLYAITHYDRGTIDAVSRANAVKNYRENTSPARGRDLPLPGTRIGPIWPRSPLRGTAPLNISANTMPSSLPHSGLSLPAPPITPNYENRLPLLPIIPKMRSGPSFIPGCFPPVCVPRALRSLIRSPLHRLPQCIRTDSPYAGKPLSRLLSGGSDAEPA
jgi:hypothetical protein